MHSHITGLGLNHRFEAEYVSGGMVGQVPARQAAGIIVKMIQVRKTKEKSGNRAHFIDFL